MGLQHQQKALRPVVLPANEQPTPSAEQAAPLVERDSRGRLRGTAAARALAKMPRKSIYVPRKFATDPRFTIHNKRRVDWTRQRRQELHEATGGVSHGVGAMIVAAGWLYAAGEFAAELAASCGDIDLFKSAASLTATARTHDMGAWELAVREGAERVLRSPEDDLARLRRENAERAARQAPALASPTPAPDTNAQPTRPEDASEHEETP
jgi:hypothetical protein